MRINHRRQSFCLWVLIVALAVTVKTDATHQPPDCPPTLSPAPTETAVPSPSPSEIPTESPGPTITASPTPKDTTPSEEPTESPAPSPSPSEVPSESPSTSPSSSMSPTDSKQPSSMPSSAPSSSAAPSLVPTRSMEPSGSSQPSVTPTNSLMPSATPSTSPSSSPSASPSNMPSAIPSFSPSVSPSAGPSSSPSSTPSVSPSDKPSATPSVSPSLSPSLGPSSSPSAGPSASPSFEPSAEPSFAPSSSGQPSASPSSSISPSATPSSSPSQSSKPSAVPTLTPSATPTESLYPSMNPTSSSAPSVLPSNVPSEAPSVSPTNSLVPSLSPTSSSQPSARPSTSPRPSHVPSITPSMRPTSVPSVVPTDSASPSVAPTNVPSASPSASQGPSSLPSSIPSIVPSIPPTIAPSGAPSIMPSTHPTKSHAPTESAQPTGSSAPSIQPTDSVAPSSFPTESPSIEPTSAPTKSQAPSQFPTYAPTLMPSGSPSKSPTTSSSPTVAPSDGPSQSPTIGVRQHSAVVELPLYNVPGIMDEVTVMTFERVALRALRELFPLFPGIKITFTYLVVVGQTLIDGNGDIDRRRIAEVASTYELQVRFHVYADIYPGDPKNFDFQIFVASFFEIHYEDFLNMLKAETDFFSIQEPPGYGPQGDGGGPGDGVPEEGSYFAIRLLSAVAAATLIVFLVSTFALKTGRRHIKLQQSLSGFGSYDVSSESVSGEFISGESSEGIKSNEVELSIDENSLNRHAMTLTVLDEETSADLSTPTMPVLDLSTVAVFPTTGLSNPAPSSPVHSTCTPTRSIFSMVEMGFRQHASPHGALESSEGDESLAERLSKWLTRTAEADEKLEKKMNGNTEAMNLGINRKIPITVPTKSKVTKFPVYAGCMALPTFGFDEGAALPPPPPPPPPPQRPHNRGTKVGKLKSLLDDEITEISTSRDADEVAGIFPASKRSRKSFPPAIDTQPSSPKSTAESTTNKRPQSTQSGRYRYEATSPTWVNFDTDNVIGYVRILPVPKKPQTMEEMAFPSSPAFASSSFDVETEISKEMASRLSEEVEEKDSVGLKEESPRMRYQRALEKSNASRIPKDPPAKSKLYRSRLPTFRTKASSPSMRMGMTGIIHNNNSSSNQGLDWDSTRNAQISPRLTGQSKQFRLSEGKDQPAPLTQIQPGANANVGGLVSPLGRSPSSSQLSSTAGSAKQTNPRLLMSPKKNKKSTTASE